jgi:hypothetical protein
MTISNKKVAANRINGQKSHGPQNTTSTRFNATKHGLLAVGITELDDAEGYRAILSDLMREKVPVGPVETFLVESVALDMLRWLRARRLEAEYITSELNPPLHAPDPMSGLSLVLHGEVLDPGLPAAISAETAYRLVGVFQRYESFFANRMFRTLHELERLQRMRLGERLPAPVTMDVSVHDDAAVVDSAFSQLEHQEVPLFEGESLPVPATVDANVHTDTGTPDSVPAAQEESKAVLVDEEQSQIAKRTH